MYFSGYDDEVNAGSIIKYMTKREEKKTILRLKKENRI